MTAISVKAVREALTELGRANDGCVSKIDLEVRFGIVGGLDRQRLNSTLKQMVRRGEALRSPDGVTYRFIPESAAPANAEECWARVYRAARISKGSFDLGYIMKTAAITAIRAKRTLDKLRECGYLNAFMSDDQIHYQATQLMRDRPDVPVEPKRENGSMLKAREAMAELNRLFLTLELTTGKARKQVCEQLAILHQAFDEGGAGQ